MLYYMSLAIFVKKNIVVQTVHTVRLTEMWLIYVTSLQSFGTVQLCTIHKEVLSSRFLLLVFVDKTTAQPYPYAFL